MAPGLSLVSKVVTSPWIKKKTFAIKLKFVAILASEIMGLGYGQILGGQNL